MDNTKNRVEINGKSFFLWNVDFGGNRFFQFSSDRKDFLKSAQSNYWANPVTLIDSRKNIPK